jgi:hypothetical protein
MRHTFTRDFYIPQGARPVDCSGTDAAVYVYEAERQGKTVPLAIGFHGKAAKPDWHHSFRDDERRQRHIASFLEGRKARAAAMTQRKAERNKPHTLKVGDILRSSWGYDQTNIDYYQVTRVPGPMTVEIREIAASSSGEDGFMTAKCTAVRDAFKGPPMIKRATADNCVRIASYAYASPWDGKADRYSWYA